MLEDPPSNNCFVHYLICYRLQCLNIQIRSNHITRYIETLNAIFIIIFLDRVCEHLPKIDMWCVSESNMDRRKPRHGRELHQRRQKDEGGGWMSVRKVLPGGLVPGTTGLVRLEGALVWGETLMVGVRSRPWGYCPDIEDKEHRDAIEESGGWWREWGIRGGRIGWLRKWTLDSQDWKVWK